MDALIGAAAADVAVHGGVDFRVRRLWRLGQKRGRRHQLARLAVAALRHLLGDPCDLQRVAGGGRQPFDRRDLLAGRQRHRRGARPDGVAVEVHGAGAALRQAAAEFGAGQADGVADDPQQGHVRRDIDVVAFAVYGQGNHGRLLRNQGGSRKNVPQSRCDRNHERGHRGAEPQRETQRSDSTRRRAAAVTGGEGRIRANN